MKIGCEIIDFIYINNKSPFCLSQLVEKKCGLAKKMEFSIKSNLLITYHMYDIFDHRNLIKTMLV